MSKQKPNPAAEDQAELQTDDLSGHFDRKAIHRAMLLAKGNGAEAHRLLVAAGLTHTRKWLNDQLHKDRILKAIWVEAASGYSDHEAPATQLSPEDAQQIEAELLRRDAEFLDRVGTENVFGGSSDKALAFADFASRSFQLSVNMIYGISVKSAFDLRERAEWIEANVLLNEEETTHTAMDKNGQLVTWQGPKYSEEDKRNWQKEYTAIMETLRKFGDSATAAAEAKIKAYKLTRDKGAGGKSSRGKRAFN